MLSVSTSVAMLSVSASVTGLFWVDGALLGSQGVASLSEPFLTLFHTG